MGWARVDESPVCPTARDAVLREARRPRLTHRGLVQAGREHVYTMRALKMARVALTQSSGGSLVCVLLERLEQVGV